MPKNKKLQYKSAFKFLFKIIEPHKIYFYSISLILLMMVGISLFQTKSSALLIDNISIGNSNIILPILSIFILLIVVSIFSNYIKGVFSAKLGASVGSDLKQMISKVLLYSKYEKIIKLESGDTLRTVNSDTQTICDFLSDEMTQLLYQFTMAIGAFIYLLILNPKIAILTFIYTPIGMYVFSSYNYSNINNSHLIILDFS